MSHRASRIRQALWMGLVLWASAFLAMVPGPADAAQGSAVEGVDRARILAPAGALIQPYRNVGYRLEWVGDEVFVEVDASPLVSSSRFELPPAPNVEDDVTRIARRVTTGAETHYDAISRVLGWVARNIDYNLDRSQDQDASAVLERRSGYCTGVAKLTVSLLDAVDIEAREVAGYVVGDAAEGPSGYHRWIEARVPDRGWVFSDPLVTHHYVPATYVRLASEELVPAQGMEGLLLERRDQVSAVDLYPRAAPGVTARRNSERQLAAALQVHLEDHSKGLAVLTGRSLRRTHVLVDGQTTFVGLEPGRYQLRLLVPGFGQMERIVELPGRVRKTLSLPTVPPAGQGR